MSLGSQVETQNIAVPLDRVKRCETDFTALGLAGKGRISGNSRRGEGRPIRVKMGDLAGGGTATNRPDPSRCE